MGDGDPGRGMREPGREGGGPGEVEALPGFGKGGADHRILDRLGWQRMALHEAGEGPCQGIVGRVRRSAPLPAK